MGGGFDGKSRLWTKNEMRELSEAEREPGEQQQGGDPTESAVGMTYLAPVQHACFATQELPGYLVRVGGLVL